LSIPENYLILKSHQESYQADIFGMYYQIILAYQYLQDEE